MIFRLQTRCLVLVVAGAIWGGTGCGDPTPTATYSGGPTGSATPPTATQPGRIFINWTVAGKPPTSSACAGVSELRLGLTYDTDQSVTIAPITCALTRFRYDNLPAGYASLIVTGLDSNGCVTLRGNVNLDVSATLPSQPTPTLDLQSTNACR